MTTKVEKLFGEDDLVSPEYLDRLEGTMRQAAFLCIKGMSDGDIKDSEGWDVTQRADVYFNQAVIGEVVVRLEYRPGVGVEVN